MKEGNHTLVLLDIKIDQKKDQFFLMSPSRAISLLKRMEAEEGEVVITDSQKVVVIGNAGSERPFVLAASFGDFDNEGMPSRDHGKTGEVFFPEGIFCLIIPGKLHFLEEEMLEKRKLEKKI